MDDWGSPWADDAETKGQLVPELLARAPPKTAVRDRILGAQTTDGGLENFKNDTPWDIDGGISEWENGVVGKVSDNIVADAFPDWTTEAPSSLVSPFDGTKKGKDISGDEHNMSWANSVGHESGESSKNLILEAPWDSTAANPSPPESADDTELSTKVGHGTLVSQSPQETLAGPQPKENYVQDEEKVADTESFSGPTNQEDDRGKLEQPRSRTNAPRIVLEEGDLSTGPSSSPSSEKCIGRGALDSPRTSFEEDDIQSQARKVASSSSLELSQSAFGAPLADPVEDFANGDDDDFGDFEEERDYVENADLERRTPPIDAPSIYIPPIQTSTTVSSPQFLSHTDVATFEVNMSLLDDLFPKKTEEVDQLDVPDEIMSTMSNRRTWYRISRNGTMREHDSGDDNYVRVTWVKSSIQAKLNAIVARWITEDRIAGGMVLGGDHTLGAMFGWGEGARDMQAKKQGGSKMDSDVLPVSSPHHKKSTAESATVSLPLALPGRKLYFASDPPIAASASLGPNEGSPTAPNFGWSTSGKRAQRAALVQPHNRNVILHTTTTSPTPVTPTSPSNAAFRSSPNARPMSMYVSGKKSSVHTRGSKSVDDSADIVTASIVSPRQSTSATGHAFRNPPFAASIPDDTRLGEVNGSVLAVESQDNPWASADLPIFDKVPLTAVPLTRLESATAAKDLRALDVGDKIDEINEDRIAEKVTQGLPDLSYMLKR